MKRLIAAVVASSFAVSALPATAQNYTGQNYQTDTQRYYENRQEYERQMQLYNENRARYERDRADYDRRYGAGSFERYYGTFREVAPVYRGNDRYDGRSDNRYDNRYSNRNGARYDPYARYYNTSCERRTASNDNRTGGTLLGALIGGAIGAVAAGDNSETEGAVLGAVVGGALGNAIASSQTSYDRYAPKCDSAGYYFTYDQTVPYRDNVRGRNGRYDNTYYVRQRCRLAIGPSDRYGDVEYRYVRVCPDRNNRYRITS